MLQSKTQWQRTKRRIAEQIAQGRGSMVKWRWKDTVYLAKKMLGFSQKIDEEP